MCVVRHAQIIQNKKFAIPLQYLKKEVIDEVDFLHAGNHENLLQIGTMILTGQAFPIIPKQQFCNVFTIFQKIS